MSRRSDDRARGNGHPDHSYDQQSCGPCCGTGRRGVGTAILGLGVVAAGIILTLDNLGMIRGEDLFSYWPLLVILVGVSHLVRPLGSRRIGTGLVWITAGGLLLLSNLGYLTFDVWDLWPLLLVIIGGSLMLRPIRRRMSGVDDSSAVFDATAILGGVHRRISAEDFQGGDATAILGGCEIDLRDSGAAGGPAEINAVAFWGGVEIRVPQDWEVRVRGTAILGGFEDKTRSIEGEGRKILVVRGIAIMGAVEISN